MHAPRQPQNDKENVQSHTSTTVSSKPLLADKRPESTARQHVADMVRASPRMLRQRAFSAAVHDSARMVAQRHGATASAGVAVEARTHALRSHAAAPAPQVANTNDTGLPDRLKAGIESLSGISLDHVRVHYNADKPAQLRAHAYAQGSDIYLGAGQERHLPHEAWHVVQQAQGRVRPTLQMRMGDINDEPALEREADVMGAQAAALQGGHPVRQLAALERGSGTTPRRFIDGMQSAVIQAVWEPYQDVADPDATFKWDQPIGGVQWYCNNNYDIWFRQVAPEAEPRPHEGTKRKWFEWQADARYKDNLPAFPGDLGVGTNDQAHVPPAFLKLMVPKIDLDKWNDKQPGLAFAHHKFPKSALAWLFEHMTEAKQTALRRALHLADDAGPKALARLRSNLISPNYKGRHVSSDHREDDPHNNSSATRPGEEALDLVKQMSDDGSGASTPRSRHVETIAEQVAKPIYLRCKLQMLHGSIAEDAFRLSDQESDELIRLLREMEELHYQIEARPTLPSHSNGEVWRETRPNRFAKQPVKPPVLPHDAQEGRAARYDRLKDVERKQRLEEEAMEREREERAPHFASFAYMGKSERFGTALMGTRPPPQPNTYRYVMNALQREWERDLFSAAYHAILDRLDDPTLVERIRAAAVPLQQAYEQMRAEVSGLYENKRTSTAVDADQVYQQGREKSEAIYKQRVAEIASTLIHP